jgi:hypothetical protein
MSAARIYSHFDLITALRDDLIASGVGSACLLHAIMLAELLQRRGCNARVVAGLALHSDGIAYAHYWVEQGGLTCDIGSAVTRGVFPQLPHDDFVMLREGFKMPSSHQRNDLDTPAEYMIQETLLESFKSYSCVGFRPWYDAWKREAKAANDSNADRLLAVCARYFD